jgi:hypothetical protein
MRQIADEMGLGIYELERRSYSEVELRDLLLHFLRNHGPLIINVNAWALRKKKTIDPRIGHGILVTGIDSASGAVIYNDPQESLPQVTTIDALKMAIESLRGPCSLLYLQ